MTKTGFEKLRVYQLAEELSDQTWTVVNKWNNLAQNTIGRQFINAADSIGANIAEGTGRSSFADNRRFAKIARASLFEVKHWVKRAYARNLLTEKDINRLQELVNELAPKLSSYINSIGRVEKNNGSKKSF